MGFSPTNDLNIFNAVMDVNRFARILTVKKHFLSSDVLHTAPNTQEDSGNTNTNSNQFTPGDENVDFHFSPHASLDFNDLNHMVHLRNLQSEAGSLQTNPKGTFCVANTHFYPIQSRPSVLDTFQDLVERDLKMLDNDIKSHKYKIRQNLNKGERKALKEVKNNLDIVVRQADKGGCVVLLNAGLYKSCNETMLHEDETYKSLSQDPTATFQQEWEQSNKICQTNCMWKNLSYQSSIRSPRYTKTSFLRLFVPLWWA